MNLKDDPVPYEDGVYSFYNIRYTNGLYSMIDYDGREYPGWTVENIPVDLVDDYNKLRIELHTLTSLITEIVTNQDTEI